MNKVSKETKNACPIHFHQLQPTQANHFFWLSFTLS
jgi:hypothetical protein